MDQHSQSQSIWNMIRLRQIELLSKLMVSASAPSSKLPQRVRLRHFSSQKLAYYFSSSQTSFFPSDNFSNSFFLVFANDFFFDFEMKKRVVSFWGNVWISAVPLAKAGIIRLEMRWQVGLCRSRFAMTYDRVEHQENHVKPCDVVAKVSQIAPAEQWLNPAWHPVFPRFPLFLSHCNDAFQLQGWFLFTETLDVLIGPCFANRNPYFITNPNKILCGCKN